MARFKSYRPKGVIAATLLAFDQDFSIDERQSRRHLTDVAATAGLNAITVNGHASEVHACTIDEQRRILEFSVDEIGDKLPIINGVFADGSIAAAQIARMAETGGASALLVFPPQSMAMGGQLRPEMAIAHVGIIAEASDLPIILFQYPLPSGLGYPLDTIIRIIDEIPSVVAIKDWSNDGALHERHIRILQGRDPRVSVLTTHSAWLMSSLTMGCDGLLSGAGSVIADLQVALFEAVQAQDLALAQRINDRIYPLAQAFYAPPFLDMHNRMKECLVMLDRLDKAVVRPPLCKLGTAELSRLKAALEEAGLTRAGGFADAAE